MKDVISNDAYACYNKLIKTNKIIYDDGKILFNVNDKNELIDWNNIKKHFRNNEIDVCALKGIGVLRRMIVRHLLNVIGFNEKCYVEKGSTTPMSDLDFTYVSYNEPNKVVPTMVKFYNLFVDIFGNYPHDVFDTNFYITSSYLSKECYLGIQNALIKKLFIPEGNFYRLYNYADPKYRIHDENICFEIQKRSIEERTEYSTNTLQKLLIYAKSFYNTLDNLGYYDNDTDEVLLHLRTLFYFMSLYSNESYISDCTFSFIVLKNNSLTEREKYLSFTDNYAYLIHWIAFYKQTHLMEFFDVTCKYMERCNSSLIGTKFAQNIDHELINHANYWRNNVRGKYSLNDKYAQEEWIKILNYLTSKNIASPSALCDIFSKVYREIKLNFVLNNVEINTINIVNSIPLVGVTIHNKKITLSPSFTNFHEVL